MRNFKSVLRTARFLLAQGLLGDDFRKAFAEECPGLSPELNKRVSAKLRKEVGILGQVMHNPNQFPNCKQAKKAKESHRNASRLILTSRTPMCSTCTNNRSNCCGLMGGRLVSSLSEVPEEAVSKVAKTLVNDGDLTKREAGKIYHSDMPAHRRVAALSLLKEVRVASPKEDVQANSEARRIGAMLDNSDQSVAIEPGRQVGPGRTLNAEAAGDVGAWEEVPGDSKIQKRARKAAKTLRAAEIPIEIPKESNIKEADVRMASTSVFDLPDVESREGREAGADEESIQQAQAGYNRLIHAALRTWDAGGMSNELASKFHARLETLKEYGAKPGRREARVARQLAAMSGELEF